jgi:hypothetical protein
MAKGPTIIIPKRHQAAGGYDPFEAQVERAAASGLIPIRIKCPDCGRIFTLYIESFDQGVHIFLGKACPFCKYFIKEKDNPFEFIIDAKEIRESMQDNNKKGG